MLVKEPERIYWVFVPGNFPLSFYDENAALARAVHLQKCGHDNVVIRWAKVTDWADFPWH